jgi:hypothetical protein
LPAASDIARPPGPGRRPPAAGQGALLIRHAVFLGLLGAGAVLRGLTTLAYRPAMEFVQDSFDYLGDARSLAPSVIRPLGYPLFLRALSVTGRFGLVAVAQHLLGLAMAVMLYQLLLRLGVRPWLAALATAPLLLDAYAVYMEQFVLAETLFGFLALAGFVVLLWRLRPSAAACALAAALLACAALTRTVGLALLAPALGYLLVTRAGVRRVGGRPARRLCRLVQGHQRALGAADVRRVLPGRAGRTVRRLRGRTPGSRGAARLRRAAGRRAAEPGLVRVEPGISPEAPRPAAGDGPQRSGGVHGPARHPQPAGRLRVHRRP